MKQNFYKTLKASLFLFVLTFSLAMPKSISAQLAWFSQSSGVFNSLQSVFFISPTQGCIVGSSGRILTTSNGGLNWTARSSGTTNHLNAVYFTSATNGCAVGHNGTILLTNDGGVTWVPSVIAFFSENLFSLQFTSSTQGWAAGTNGTVITTNDGGLNWTFVSNPAPSTIRSIFFTSATEGHAVSSIGVHRTSNGGTTWTTQSPNVYMTSVFFISSMQGWIGGLDGSIYTTLDGGTTWTQQLAAGAGGGASIYFVSPSEGWTVGGSSILVTTDSGTTWTAQTPAIIENFASTFFISPTKGWTVGGGGTINVYQTCPAVDTTVTNNGITLTSNATGVTYQWLDCSNNMPIAGATTQSFTATANGDYAVVVSQGICSDTSACFSIVGVGINSIENSFDAAIYPNPSSSSVTVETKETIDFIAIYDARGSLVQTENQKTFSVKELPTGIYLLQIKTSNSFGTAKFVKE